MIKNESSFVGNAEAEWKAVWRVRKKWRSPRWWMLHCRREAALERKLAAAQRTIDAQAAKISEIDAECEEQASRRISAEGARCRLALELSDKIQLISELRATIENQRNTIQDLTL